MRQSASIMIAALLLCAACSETPRTTPRAQDSSSIASAPSVDSASRSTGPATIQHLPFDAKTTPPLDRAFLPKEFLTPGKVIGGARWIDANGENTLVIEERMRDADEYEKEQELMAYAWITKQGESPRLLWKIHDMARNPCDQGEGLISDIDVRDLNNDGIAETTFLYNVVGSCDVSPIPFKLMLHSDGKKYAVRGTNMVNPGDRWIGGEKKFDTAFASAPKEFRDHASGMWTKYVGKRKLGPE